MSYRFNAHPLAMWLAAAAVATGISYSADLTRDVEGTAGLPVFMTAADTVPVDAVVIEVQQTTVDLHIPANSPFWNGSSAVCRAVSGVLTMIGYANPGCQQNNYRPPNQNTVDYTLYVTDDDVRMDFGGQSMIGDVRSDGSLGDWKVLDRATGRSIDWVTPAGGGPGLAAAGGSTMLANLIAGIGSIRTVSRGPQPGPTFQSQTGPSLGSYSYGYTVSGGIYLPDGTETGVAIGVDGLARYANQGPFLTDGRIVTVLDNLSGNMLFQHLEPPDELTILRDSGGLLQVNEEVKFYVYRAAAPPGNLAGGAVEVLRGVVETKITDARREQVPASTFGALGQAQGCDCSCTGKDEFMRIAELSEEEQEQDPQTMVVLACARQCVRQWALGCHQ